MKFRTLNEAINSFYAMKVGPSIEVILQDKSNVAGRLAGQHDADDAIVVSAGGSQRRFLRSAEIERVDLFWHGSDWPEMGELDGTGNEGMAIPSAYWHHQVFRDGDSWVIKEVSKE